MLVLSRKLGERIRIGPLPDGSIVWIEVVDLNNKTVRLGITAPQSVKVFRAELLDRTGDEMSKPTNVIDESDPNANMYGCLPCPQCGSKYRWPTQPAHPVYPSCILCDYCDFVEPAVRKEGAT